MVLKLPMVAFLSVYLRSYLTSTIHVETQMPSEIVRPVRDDELAAVLRLWQLAAVTPPSVSDSIEGLTRLLHEPVNSLDTRAKTVTVRNRHEEIAPTISSVGFAVNCSAN